MSRWGLGRVCRPIICDTARANTDGKNVAAQILRWACERHGQPGSVHCNRRRAYGKRVQEYLWAQVADLDGCREVQPAAFGDIVVEELRHVHRCSRRATVVASTCTQYRIHSQMRHTWEE